MSLENSKPLLVSELVGDFDAENNAQESAPHLATSISPNVTVREHPKVGMLCPRKKTVKKEEKTTCAICLDMAGKKNVSTTKCGHTFCLTCLHQHLKTSHLCPCCRGRILDKKPEKPLVKLNKKTAIKMIQREMRDWDVDMMIEGFIAFKSNARNVLRGDFQRFGLELMKQFMYHQINGDEDDENDYDDTSDTESEEEGPIFVSSGHRGRRIIIDDDDDDDEREDGEISDEDDYQD